MSHLRTIAENIEKTIGRSFGSRFFPVVSQRVNKLQRAFSLRKTLFGEKFKWFGGNFLCLSPMASLKFCVLYFLIIFVYTKRERNMCGVRAFSSKCPPSLSFCRGSRVPCRGSRVIYFSIFFIKKMCCCCLIKIVRGHSNSLKSKETSPFLWR